MVVLGQSQKRAMYVCVGGGGGERDIPKDLLV